MRPNKTRLFFFTLIFCIVLHSGAGAVTLKIATLSPEGSMWMEKLHEGAQKVKQSTEGRVTFKFYPSGRMGTDKMVLKKIKIGQLHGGAVVSGSLSHFFPANQLYAQPMKFTSLDEVDYVRQHMDEFIIKGLEDKGFITFGLIGGGFSYIMSKHRIETVADLRQHKVWIPDNDTISQESIDAFNLSPIPLPIADVRISLQSGLVDTVATSPLGALVLQWHTQIKYITQVPLIYLHAVLAVDKKRFMKISPDDQAMVREIMGQVSNDIQSRNRADDIKNIEVLKNQGIEFIIPGPDAMKEWRETGALASQKMIESGTLPKDTAEKVDRLLETFNENRQTANAQ